MNRRLFLQTLGASAGSAVYVRRGFASSTDPVPESDPRPATDALADLTYLSQFEYAGESRHHLYQRRHWTAREEAGISRTPDTYVDPYCTPSQQAVPLLMRWMLVLEDSDEERLYLGRGIPRSWIASGREISIKQAPTRWGGVSLSMTGDPNKRTLGATVGMTNRGKPKELHLTLRVPEGTRLHGVAVNGKRTEPVGPRNDTVVVRNHYESRFEVIAQYG